MNITDELVRRFRDAYQERVGWALRGENIRAALEATLGDVPELSDLDRGSIESMKHNAQRMREECRRERARAEAAEAKLAQAEDQAARASELEAQLEEVRIWYDAYREAEAMLPGLGEILGKR